MKPSAPNYKNVPLPIVGSTKFGRHPKISSEETWNMIISDGWLVPFAGYKNVLEIDTTGEGRGIYSSTRLDIMLVVVDDDLWVISSALNKQHAGSLSTFSGDVFISENNRGEFAISDLNQVYIYTFATNTLAPVPALVGIKPGHITFQDDRFIVPDLNTNNWYLSDTNSAFVWPAENIGALTTKPDKVQATIRVPGRGNALFVFGQTVTELWQDVGAQVFPYQRSTNSNLDYGCANAATIAESDNLVCWLAQNEKSGYSIMVSTGGMPKRISNDGIDFKLARLTNAENSYAFIFKQDGHLIYALIFPADNFSICYDFNTQMFFTLSDENFDNFIARRVVFFNNTYFFVSLRDGNLYELSTRYTDYDYGTLPHEIIPRVRITPNFRLPDQSRFITGYVGMTMESGITNETQAVQLNLSKDGGVSYGSVVTKELPTLGKRQNRVVFWRLGIANDLTLQFRFYGFARFLATNGVMGIHQ